MPIVTVSPSVYATTYVLTCYGLVPGVAVEDVDLRLVGTPPPLLTAAPATARGQ